MTTQTTKRLGLAMACCVFMAGMVACSSRSNPRRLSIGETTEAELRDPRQLPASMNEFQAAAANDLLQALPTMPLVSELDGRVTILLGDINNKTSLVSTTDYEYVVSGIRSRLIRSGVSRAKLRFVEKRTRVENLALKERVATGPAPAGADAQAIKWAGGQYYVPDYQAANTFGLFMNVYRIGRGTTNQYQIVMQLVSLGTNEIVYNYKAETKQTTR